MEINIEKQLNFVMRPWLKTWIMTRLCMLFLLCSIVAPSAGVVTPDGEDSLQQTTLSGKVADAATGEALIGVSVVVKGTTLGALTDINGNFSIPVPGRQQVTLLISFIGYTTQEILATPGMPVNATLAIEVTQIQEVVVVGYGTQKKESVVGAITQVDNATLMQAGTTNITNAITGKLSGVLTIQATGEPGAGDSEIIIRGLSSWNGSQPLVLVDGVERDFSLLDPNEIGTISVLKDASATAVFGAKGANGVIVVTSKRGTTGKPKVDFSASYGLQKATRIPDHIDAYTTMSLLNVARMNAQLFHELSSEEELEEYRNPSTPLNSLRYPDVNWFDICTKTFAPATTANFNISGGTEFIKYFFSLGHQYQGTFFDQPSEGFLDNRYFNHQGNYRINIDFSLTKSTILSLNVGGQLELKNQPSSSPWRNLYSTGPSRFPAYFPEWVLDIVPDTHYPDASGKRFAASFGEYTGNPYTSLNQPSFNRYLGSTLFTDLILNQKLDNILKGLSVNGKVSLSTYYRNRSLYLDYSYPDYLLYYERIGIDENKDGIPDQNPWFRTGEGNETYYLPPYDVNVGGLESGYYRDLYYEMSMNYSNNFGKHAITGLALFNRQQQNNGTDFPYYNEGLVGRATYAYNRKYLLEFNVGYTGSERFAPENRFGFFPSAAIGWVVSEEQFFRNSVPWMNNLKIRYSDGLVGSDYAKSRWLYTSSYYKDNQGHIREDLGANTMAQWEMAHKRDIGLEIGIFKDLFTINVDFFDEYRSKMLLTPKNVTMFIGNTFKELNVGEVKKHGFEIEAEFRNRSGNNLEYYIRGMFGFNENRVVYKADPPYSPEYRKLAGKPLTEMLSPEFGIEGLELAGVLLTGSGYYETIDDIQNYPAPCDLGKLFIGEYKFLDFDVDGTITTLDKYPIKGLTYPPITYSFSSGFTYKNFDFNFLFSGNLGKYVQFNQGFEKEFVRGDWRVHQSQLDYWTPTNLDATHTTMHYNGSGDCPTLIWGGGSDDRGYHTMIEDRYFRNASYLRLKDVYAGYTFNTTFLNNLIGVSNMLVYATGNNLLTFTKLIEGDPERKDFIYGFYPIMATVKVGVKLIS